MLYELALWCGGFCFYLAVGTLLANGCRDICTKENCAFTKFKYVFYSLGIGCLVFSFLGAMTKDRQCEPNHNNRTITEQQ